MGPFHMWLEGCPNPYKMEQSWECTFLKPFTHMKTKLGWKKFFIIGLQRYKIASMADLAHQGWISLACWLVVLKSNYEICFWCWFCIHIGKEFQKSALPTLFHFVRVRAALQPHVISKSLTVLSLFSFFCILTELEAACIFHRIHIMNMCISIWRKMMNM